MSDKSRYDERQREAVPSRKSRWDRSSRDESRWGQRRSDHQTESSRDRYTSSPTEHSQSRHRHFNDDESSGSRFRDRSPREDRDRESQRVSETYYPVDREGSSSWSHSYGSYNSEQSTLSSSAQESQHTDSTDNLDSLRDEALEEQFRKYERECQAQSSYESQKRDFKTAFTAPLGSDSVPSDELDEPIIKKTGFSMTMNKSQASSSPMSSGFSMSLSKPMTFNTSSQPKKPVAPIKMSLGVQKPKAPPTIRKPAAVANVFNDDDDSEEEEMPPEAKMRMRNLGRETPTAAGPNSFGKGNLGFCDRHKIIQRELQKKMDDIAPKN